MMGVAGAMGVAEVGQAGLVVAGVLQCWTPREWSQARGHSRSGDPVGTPAAQRRVEAGAGQGVLANAEKGQVGLAR